MPGFTGPTGQDGIQGQTGPTGISMPGFTGPTGQDGIQGETGPTGISMPGFTGPTGQDGIQGQTGPTGISMPGFTGPTGTAGPTGSSSSFAMMAQFASGIPINLNTTGMNTVSTSALIGFGSSMDISTLGNVNIVVPCLLYTSPSPRDRS